MPREYYAQAFKDGRLRVEDKAHLLYLGVTKRRGKKSGEEYFPALVPGQTVHLVHKHEPPVLCSRTRLFRRSRRYRRRERAGSIPAIQPDSMKQFSGGNLVKFTRDE